MKGILIIGHGSRLAEVNETFNKTVEILKESTKANVYGGNLSLAKPSVEDTIDRMYEDGVRRIVAIPYLLSDGKHVTIGIPNVIKVMQDKYKDLEIIQETSLKLNSLVMKAVEEKIYNNI